MQPSPQQFSNSDYEFRYLEETDYGKGMFEVLAQLTKAPLPSLNSFSQYWETVRQSANKHINIVGVDRKREKIIAFGSIIITQSVLNGKLGKIENIVTCKSVRGKGLGKVIIEALKNQGWKEGCQIISLFCEEKNVKFYEKLDFKTEGQILAAYKI